MQVSIMPYGQAFRIAARAEGPGGMVGDAERVLEPGETFFGVPFDIVAQHRGETVSLEVLQRDAAAAREAPPR